ncbi:vegetative cell wall protein gp1-like [Eumetopias jubatus]|uniref:vegetative cell wall protein gp1-like n=1 Tax=Eumetopias jubatus TaxID=34886 RepID=UPI0010162590|nr:vegetative cell wall protein gp1-like [Eumetopias jubatus]
MEARPPVRQRSSPDAVRIRLLMKRHKEPAPARPPTPAPQTRAPAWRGPGALCPGSPPSAPYRAPGLQSRGRLRRAGGPACAPAQPRRARARPRPSPRGRARPRPPAPPAAPDLLSPRVRRRRRSARRPAGPARGPSSSAPDSRRLRPPRQPAAGPARLPAQRAPSAAHSRPPGAILEACDVQGRDRDSTTETPGPPTHPREEDSGPPQAHAQPVHSELTPFEPDPDLSEAPIRNPLATCVRPTSRTPSHPGSVPPAGTPTVKGAAPPGLQEA